MHSLDSQIPGNRPIDKAFELELERGNCACCARYDDCEDADTVKGHCERFKEMDDLVEFEERLKKED